MYTPAQTEHHANIEQKTKTDGLLMHDPILGLCVVSIIITHAVYIRHARLVAHYSTQAIDIILLSARTARVVRNALIRSHYSIIPLYNMPMSRDRLF